MSTDMKTIAYQRKITTGRNTSMNSIVRDELGAIMFQVIGNKKCILTKKALRYCKERNIAHQFVDLQARELAIGEWEKIFSSINSEDLVDTSSKYYKKEGYAWREYNAKEELMSHSELLKTPIIKYKQKAFLLETEQDLSKMESIV